MFNSPLRKFLTGYSLTQEYICVPFEEVSSDFKVVLECGERREDVTNRHFFLGYKPVIFGVTGTVVPVGVSSCSLMFIHDDRTVAIFSLKPFAVELIGDSGLLLFEVLSVQHRLQSHVYQVINRLLEALRKKPAGNVHLSAGLYDQVRVAYAIPRIISVVSIADGDNLNMFPTDLHGKVSDSIYVSSLRIGGKASEQVERLMRICIADVACEQYREVYDLGKNHMRDLRPSTDFPVVDGRSQMFNIPLPVSTLKYRELELIKSVDIGIHRIHLYAILNEVIVNDTKATLSHVHKLYGQWRIDHCKPTRFLYR